MGMRVLTVAEVADALHCTIADVRRHLINTGRLRAIHIRKRKCVVSEEDLESFIQKRGE